MKEIQFSQNIHDQIYRFKLNAFEIESLQVPTVYYILISTKYKMNMKIKVSSFYELIANGTSRYELYL